MKKRWTKEQFEEYYCRVNNRPLESFTKLGRGAVPCNCDYESCHGWGMVNLAEYAEDQKSQQEFLRAGGMMTTLDVLNQRIEKLEKWINSTGQSIHWIDGRQLILDQSVLSPDNPEGGLTTIQSTDGPGTIMLSKPVEAVMAYFDYGFVRTRAGEKESE